jgi:hypothetical protein
MLKTGCCSPAGLAVVYFTLKESNLLPPALQRLVGNVPGAAKEAEEAAEEEEHPMMRKMRLDSAFEKKVLKVRHVLPARVSPRGVLLSPPARAPVH